MSIIDDLKKGPVENANAVTDHFFERLQLLVGGLLKAAENSEIVVRISLEQKKP